MSTTVIVHPSTPTRQSWSDRSNLIRRLIPLGSVVLLTFASLLIHGYHPNAEDGGLYAAGIKRLLNPVLYPHSADFVDAHLRFSLFAPAIATVVRVTHLRLSIVLLAVYLLCIAATLTGAWLLARRCYSSLTTHIGAMMLTAAWLTIPVAGTSLILVDPYVTARSISLPCTLFAFVATIELLRARTLCAKLAHAALCTVMLLFAVLAHPLMAAYALGDVLLLGVALSRRPSLRRWGTVTLCLIAFAAAGLIRILSPTESLAYVQVAITRYYWFLSRWQWYEIVGLVAPLVILAVVARTSKSTRLTLQTVPERTTCRALAHVALASGLTSILVALVFAHEAPTRHLVARLQPLRTFQTIYVLMILVLGASLGEYFLGRHLWRWIATFAFLGSIMFYVQRSTYPSSAHIEWRDVRSLNQWEQAFYWIRSHTPSDALFALDAHYISQPGEDAQSFRAISERDALPDYSKDGGEASITPSLTAAWTTGQFAQHDLDHKTDTERLRALRPFNVGWIVLQQHAQTSFPCPYENDLVKVCHLP